MNLENHRGALFTEQEIDDWETKESKSFMKGRRIELNLERVSSARQAVNREDNGGTGSLYYALKSGDN